MDFGMLPPEINSGRMYAGPGSASMLAAAQAWAHLADELYLMAGVYESVVAGLTAGPWSGPASASMAAAAAPYVQWLGGTAAQAAETAAQATEAVAAYEAAFAATVPPPIVAANRSLLAALVATNFFGQNTPAIAATEAHYAEMWAQDAVAMYTYAGSSAAATRLTPLTPPPQDTTPGGQAGQAAAVGQAVTAPAGAVQNTVSSGAQGISAVPTALQGLATAAPAAASTPLTTLADFVTIFVDAPSALATIGVLFPISILDGAIDFPYAVAGMLLGFHTDDIVTGWSGMAAWPGNGPGQVLGFPATLTGLSPPTVSAGLAGADTVGALSVPAAWTVAAPAAAPAASAPRLTGLEIPAAESLKFGSSSALANMGLAGMTGRALAGPPGAGADGVRVTGRPVSTGLAGPDAGGDREAPRVKPRVVVTGVAAKIREITRLRDEGRLTDEEYAKLKTHLLGR